MRFTITKAQIQTLSEEVVRLKDGRQTFASFERRTRRQRAALARDIDRRWPRSSAVGVEDLEQELLIGMLDGLRGYDPNHPKAPPVGTHVIWRGVAHAKRAAVRDRHAGRDRTHGKPKFALCEEGLKAVSRMHEYPNPRDRADIGALGGRNIRAPQLDAEQVIDAMRAARCEEERRVVAALLAGFTPREVAEVYATTPRDVSRVAAEVIERTAAA